ncbi:MAG: type II secretion system protein GspD [Candidatus Abyssobacteria bacterium SURF_17]|uniref:Type II secretion system protein GspD n=1 Tax=Candidatus Abyssobacteria bacterium SURF_17 TaxID=2093361 RepID=A0A419EN02_9BACT|nr:MAG: type II secretion system protein GspD [Candidatus Abyssubacteria bacterium SURF_17]
MIRDRMCILVFILLVLALTFGSHALAQEQAAEQETDNQEPTEPAVGEEDSLFPASPQPPSPEQAPLGQTPVEETEQQEPPVREQPPAPAAQPETPARPPTPRRTAPPRPTSPPQAPSERTVAPRPEPRRPLSIESNNDISINFDNAPIIEVIDVMSRVTGKNFIIDPGVKGTVTVIAPKRVPKTEVYGVFESILELNGFSLVPMGAVIKVVPSRTATQKSIPVSVGREATKVHEGDQIITQLIPVKYTDAQAIVTIMTPLISRDANITAYPNTNTIILTETSSNIKRLLDIVKEIDVPGFELAITIIPLVNAQADVLAQEILQALEPSAAAAPGVPTPRTTRRRVSAQPQAALAGTTSTQLKIIPDSRTNSLIVVANEFDTEQVQFLVRELDKITPVEANNIHVYRLENALAEEVAAVLTSLAGTTTPAAGQAGAAAPGLTTGVRTFYKEVSVVADKTTNSLIIIATPQDYAVISRVIEQLDVMRPQVLVETLIAEVSLDFARDLGIQWLAANPHGQDHGFAGVGQSTGNSLLGTVGTAIAEGTPVIGLPSTFSGMSIGYVNIDEDFIRAFVEISASEGNDDFNVLSAPHVLTLDNQKAVINISDNVPFITQRVTDVPSGGTTTTNETFEYRDVGIILEITPHISPDRMVRLEIVQKVNDVAELTTGTAAGALSEKKREANTSVMVKDRYTLVLGGLIRDTDTVNTSKVPFLGDIPVLGWAFKSTSTNHRKTNLLIFVTPSIVTNVAEATELTLEKRGEAGEQLQKRMESSAAMRRCVTLGESGANSSFQEAGPK